jgi:hypothetical protein
MDMRFVTWIVRSLCRSGTLKTVASEVVLDLVAVQEVRWGRGGIEPVDDYTFICGKGNAKYHLGTGFFLYKGIKSAVKMVEFISDRMLYIIIISKCDIVLNICAPTYEKYADIEGKIAEID